MEMEHWISKNYSSAESKDAEVQKYSGPPSSPSTSAIAIGVATIPIIILILILVSFKICEKVCPQG
jgi:hypothetical protein